MTPAPAPASSQRFLLLALVGELALGLLAALLGWWLWDDPLPQVGWVDGLVLRDALWATLPLAVAAGLMTSRAGQRVPAFRRVQRVLAEAIGGPLRELDLAGLAALAAAAGLAEELLFRGVLQPLWGLWPAALLFGLVHALTPTYCLLATGMGLYLGWLAQESGNLAVPILVHALYDLYALWVVRRALRADDDLRRAREITERGEAARREREAAQRATHAEQRADAPRAATPQLPQEDVPPVEGSTEPPTEPPSGGAGPVGGVEAPADGGPDRRP